MPSELEWDRLGGLNMASAARLRKPGRSAVHNHPVTRILEGMPSQCWRTTVIAITAGTLLACRPAADRREAGESGIDSTLRAELLTLVAEDQDRREEIPQAIARNDSVFLKRLMAGDSARTARLKAIIDEHGWPGADKVGADGASAAWLLLQHSPDSALQERMLPVLEREAAAGRLEARDVATLTDRVLVRSGKPQRYGSSFEIRDGRMVAHPIEDLAGLDARRAAVGLPPMAEYVKLLADAYKQPVEWPPR